MKINNDITELICQLEYLIGKEVVNKKSYGSYKYPLTAHVYRLYDIVLEKDGWIQDFTYPIEFSDASHDFGEADKFLQEMHYTFGINKLYVGKAIINILDYLEKRYSIDFAKLEAKHNVPKNTDY